MLIISIILVNFALIIYTVSILNEFNKKTLLTWHVVMFCIGFTFDIVGTFLMYKLAGNNIPINLHDILGYIALSFMLINALGSIFTLKKYKSLLNKFYKFSVFAWIIWIISYIFGIYTHI